MIYHIELDRWGIKKDGTDAAGTAAGINKALVWAKSQGYHHVVLPDGSYLVRINPVTFTAIELHSGMHFELSNESVVMLESNSSPNYNVFRMAGLNRAKLSGGRIVGDKKTHIYELQVRFVRGGVNADGSLNDDPNWIRSEVLDRYAHPGLLASFRLWNLPDVTASGYSFFQYKDSVSRETLAGMRSNGIFAPASSEGRGWFLNDQGGIAANNKMVFAVNITGSPLTDAQISRLRGRVDNYFYTHESGFGIGLFGSNHIEISNVDISNCTGDGIHTAWLQYHVDASKYTQEQMGQHIRIHNCIIHHCRRQGISLCASNDTYVYHNKIYHIGYDDDGVTTNFRNGTAPMFGIDIESMLTESNIPYKSPERPGGLELNYRIHIYNNHISNNARGHFVNADGTNVVVESNTFEGHNIGGISSNPNYRYVKYLNNTFIDCELWVQGDNFVNGGVFHRGNLRFLDVRGAVVQNCQIKDGMVYGSSVYGYFGTPTVNVATGTFTYSSPHGMGNGASISFEQWQGKVPSGFSVDQLYYTVNITPNSFQVSASPGGPPILPKDAGQAGFNISRYNYGRCYISGITIERDWRMDNALTPNFRILAAGAVIRNITVKNYDVQILVPQNYVGRPIDVEGLTLIEGAARFEACHISGSKFIRARTGLMGAMDIQLGSNDANFTRSVTLQNSLLHGLGLVVDGNASVTAARFVNAVIGKADNANRAVIANCSLDNTRLNFNWLTRERSVTLANNVFNAVTVNGSSAAVRQLDNTIL